MSQAVAITSGGSERLAAAVSLLSDAFRNDPTINYFMNSLDDDDARDAYRPRLFHSMLSCAALNDGVFYWAKRDMTLAEPQAGSKSEVGDGCMAVLMKPGKRIDGVLTAIRSGGVPTVLWMGLSAVYRILGDFEWQSNMIKWKSFRNGERYYYLYFIGTDERDRGQGLSSEIVRDIQQTARRDNAPIYLEATTPYSRQIYARLGFQPVKDFIIGKGRADKDGKRAKGGEGVPVCAMIWRPGDDKEER